jgi:multidrug efflux pump subunit AcrB
MRQARRVSGTVADIIRNNPTSGAGLDDRRQHVNRRSNLGQIVVHLKPRDQRKELANDIIEAAARASRRPGMQVYLQNPPTIRIGGRVSKASISSRCSRRTGRLTGVRARW